MKYKKIWKKVLNPDEKVKYEFSISDRYRRFMIIFLIFVLSPLLFMGSSSRGVFFVAVISTLIYFGWYIKISNAYALTDKRILIYQGWIATEAKSIEYNKITDIKVEEPFFEKLIIHSGNLFINTAGSPEPEIILKHIEKPYEIKKKIDQFTR